MRKTRSPDPTRQLGFDALLRDAEQANHARKMEQKYAHLPSTMEDAVPFLWELLDEHHAAMVAGLADETMWCREEARNLAVHLNGGRAGILANETSPGYVLADVTAAAPGEVPLWGQKASFIITVGEMRVRIDMDGVYGLFATTSFWLTFSAHVVDVDRPFISETGYRSFLGVRGDPVPGLTPDAFAVKVIAEHVRTEMKGKLVAIEDRYRPPAA